MTKFLFLLTSDKLVVCMKVASRTRSKSASSENLAFLANDVPQSPV